MQLLTFSLPVLRNSRSRIVASFSAISIFLSFFSIPSAHAVSIGSGSCISTATTNSGVIVVSSGSTCYVVFTAIGSNGWTAPSGVTSANFLIIAGGGAGGAGAWGGGGGAGELVSYTSYAVSSASATSLSVGGGGSSGTASLDPTLNKSNVGTDSWIGSSSGVVAKGGGNGASYGYSSAVSYTTGGDGGSGGGGSEQTSASPGGSTLKTTGGNRTGYGNNGGSGGNGSGTNSGGGGGGSGAVGANAVSSNGGNGGNGTTLFSTWITAISSQMAAGWQTATTGGYIAAGGGGASSSGTRGTGGSGGGGAGANNSILTGVAAVANTGSGGGGASYSTGANLAGAGASGLIVIQYTPLVAPTNSVVPNISGTATNGQTLTADNGTWANTPTSYSYQWRRAATSGGTYSDIAGATSQSYTLVNADVGQFLKINVTATNAAGSATASSVATQNVLAIQTSLNISTTSGSYGTAINLTTSGGSGSGAVTYAYSAGTATCSLSGNVLTALSIGTCLVTATKAADSNYSAITSAQTTITFSIGISMATVSLSVSNPVFRQSSVITGTASTTGKVSFKANNSYIAGCRSLKVNSVNSYTQTCAYKPSIRGYLVITILFTPSDANFDPTSATSPRYFIGNRSGNRG